MQTDTAKQTVTFDADVLRKILVEELASAVQKEQAEIDTAKSFDEYGLDSTDAVILVGVLEERLQAQFDPELLLQHRTIDAVVQALTEQAP